MPRSRLGTVLAAGVAVTALGSGGLLASADARASADHPTSQHSKPTAAARVLIVLFDQMVPQYADQFDMPNFRRLRDGGTNFDKAFLGYMASETVISHNVIPSGLLREGLDLLGWRDPKAPARAYLVVVRDDQARGVALRAGTDGRRARKTMCDLCLTVGNATLMVAPRAGRPGQRGESVGTYVCADLDCSLFARGRRSSGTIVMEERLSVEERVERLDHNLDVFLARVAR